MGLTAKELVRGTVELVSLPESRVDTIRHAVALVGTRELRDLALATVVVRIFEGIPPELMDMERFWEHSLLTGLVARALCRHRGDHGVESRFVAGLLHDVGKLLMCRRVPELARHALARATYEQLPLPEAEQEALGFDHAEVGGLLLAAWRLPEPLVVAARWHHAPELAPALWRDEALIVHLANVLAHRDEPPPTPPQPLLAEDAWARIGVAEETGPALLEAARQDLATARAMLFAPPSRDAGRLPRRRPAQGPPPAPPQRPSVIRRWSPCSIMRRRSAPLMGLPAPAPPIPIMPMRPRRTA